MEGCRSATAEDLPRIAELARGHRVEVEQYRGGLLWRDREAVAEPLEDSYGALLDDAEACVLVGTIDDVVIGFGVGTVDRLRTGQAPVSYTHLTLPTNREV